MEVFISASVTSCLIWEDRILDGYHAKESNAGYFEPNGQILLKDTDYEKYWLNVKRRQLDTLLLDLKFGNKLLANNRGLE